MKSRTLVIGLLILTSFACLFHVGQAVLDYKVAMMDLNAPTLPIYVPHFPAPPTSHEHLPTTLPPFENGTEHSPVFAAPEGHFDICSDDDPCRLRQQSVI